MTQLTGTIDFSIPMGQTTVPALLSTARNFQYLQERDTRPAALYKPPVSQPDFADALGSSLWQLPNTK